MPDHKRPKPGILTSLFFCFFFFLAGSPALSAQEAGQQPGDTIIVTPGESISVSDSDTAYHDPKKAVIYSAILPGLGQIYNKKIWKVPIIYAGFATFIYYIDRNQKYYKDLKQKLIDPDYEMKYFDGVYTTDQLTRGKDTYRRWRDMSYIGTGAFYVLQIIDASVDAYMFDWDVSPDISLHIEPASIYSPVTPFGSLGMKACLSF